MARHTSLDTTTSVTDLARAMIDIPSVSGDEATLADAIEAATERELVEQEWQRKTADFREGVKAMAERRLPDFQGR